ncbi:MAG: hypothetical protein V1762_00665 [Nitrospirota bacterium]
MNAFADISEIHKEKEITCPHCNSERSVCMASISSMRLGIVERLVYCGSENYDNCPIFLAKVLRGR